MSDWYQKNTLSLLQEIERVRQKLANFIKGETAIATVTDFVSDTSALAQLCHCFNLSRFERDILLSCVGMEIEPNISS